VTNKNDALPVVAWEIDGECVRTVFSMKSSADSYLKGLISGHPEGGYAISELVLKSGAEAELAELRESKDRWKELAHQKHKLLDESREDYNQLQAELAALREQKPVAHQFQGRDGEWYGFQGEKHYEATVADGSWPIRALYAAPLVSDKAAGWLESLEKFESDDDGGSTFVRLGDVRDMLGQMTLNPLAADVAQVPRDEGFKAAKLLLPLAQAFVDVLGGPIPPFDKAGEDRLSAAKTILSNARALLATRQADGGSKS